MNIVRGIHVPMRAPLYLLLTTALAAQDGLPMAGLQLDVRTDLGTSSTERIVLAPHGCWDGLILSSAAPRAVKPTHRRTSEATVEVWDLLYQEPIRKQVFRLFRDELLQSIRESLKLPPPSHGQIELAEFMGADPSHPEAAGLNTVRSLQNRYNALPPGNTRVK